MRSQFIKVLALNALAFAGFATLAGGFAAAQQAAQSSQQQAGQQSSSAQPVTDPAPGREWTKSGSIAIPMPQDQKPASETAVAERRKQIVDESTELLKLATDLKSEVDKTTKDTLSLNVIRKADEIEKLAHTVKEKMKTTPKTN